MQNFRAHSSARQMYVQGYSSASRMVQLLSRLFALGPKRYREISTTILQPYLDGSVANKADYRVFLAAETDKPPRLAHLSESDFGEPGPIYQFSFDGKRYSSSFLSYLRGLAYLKKLVSTEEIESAIEIGGGYGTLGEILLKCTDKEYFYVDVDIPPLAYVATRYLQEVFGAANIATYDQTRNMDVIDLGELRKQFRAAVLCSWQLPRVVGSAELFVNYISFQEMEPEVVKNYARDVQRLTTRYLLLRNSVSGKKTATKPGELGVAVPVVRGDYIANFDLFRLVGADSEAFGHRAYNGFVSECMVFQRKAETLA